MATATTATMATTATTGMGTGTPTWTTWRPTVGAPTLRCSGAWPRSWCVVVVLGTFACWHVGIVLTDSDWAFTVLKVVGAAYLVWLGIGLLRTRSATSFTMR